MKPSADRSAILAHVAIDKGIPVYRLTSKEVPAEEARQVTIIAQERMLKLAGATREEIDVVLRRTNLTMMVERGELSVEHAELLTALEKQYPQMVSTLERYGLIPNGEGKTTTYRETPKSSLPSWEQIKNGLNAEVLEKARKLEEPTLVIVPPVSRQAMVEAINAHKVPGQEHDTYVYEPGNNDLWNGGKPEGDALPWEVAIVTGVRDVKADKAIKGTNYQRAKAWVNKYAGQGVDVINDARTYFTLMMRSLAAGKPIDKETWTVLNAKNLTESSLVAYGGWYSVQVYLVAGDPGNESSNLRPRGSVRVM